MDVIYNDEEVAFYQELGFPGRAMRTMIGAPLPKNAEIVYQLALDVMNSERCHNLRIHRRGCEKDEIRKTDAIYSSPPYFQETNGLLRILTNSNVDIKSFSTMFRQCRSGILQDPYVVGYLMEKAQVSPYKLSEETEEYWIKLETLLRDIELYWDEIEKYNGKTR